MMKLFAMAPDVRWKAYQNASTIASECLQTTRKSMSALTHYIGFLVQRNKDAFSMVEIVGKCQPGDRRRRDRQDAFNRTCRQLPKACDKMKQLFQETIRQLTDFSHLVQDEHRKWKGLGKKFEGIIKQYESTKRKAQDALLAVAVLAQARSLASPQRALPPCQGE